MSDGNLKAPSQIFRWFEKMKSNYEMSVQKVLSQFETYNLKQQERLDIANNAHISDLKNANETLDNKNKNHINQLNKDISYYKEQIAHQQQTIEQLNSRYDAVMACLINEKSAKNSDIKTIFDNDDFFNHESNLNVTSPIVTEKSKSKIGQNSNIVINTTDEEIFKNSEIVTNSELATGTEEINEDIQLNADEIFEKALQFRHTNEFQKAFDLFRQSAKLNHPPSMGAMARSYFIAEGVDEDQVLGLAWLIKAAQNKLPQAISRLAHFRENDPELYQQATNLSENDLS